MCWATETQRRKVGEYRGGERKTRGKCVVAIIIEGAFILRFRAGEICSLGLRTSVKYIEIRGKGVEEGGVGEGEGDY